MKNQAALNSYSGGIKFFHWLIAVMVLAMLSFGFFLEDLPEQYQPLAFMMHKSTGLTILFLMIVRFIWVLYCGKPSLPKNTPLWEILLSRFVQYCFYVFIICMPLAGWISSVAANRVPSYFGLFPLSLPIEPNKALATFMIQSHVVIAWILIALIVLHVFGAIKHHVIDKDNVLKRMLPGGE
jgi:cytochrome b561